jgi:hypothetical protein
MPKQDVQNINLLIHNLLHHYSEFAHFLDILTGDMVLYETYEQSYKQNSPLIEH